MATVETLLTAEEYGLMPDNGQRNELVRGRVVARNTYVFDIVEPAPDFVVFERQEHTRWSAILKMVGSDLKSGVSTVSIVDRLKGSAYIVRDDEAPRYVALDCGSIS